jgi:site-specific DNA-methyltransferase (adenine-specific)
MDPFMGSGTTGKMAIINEREFTGFEIAKEYFDIAEIRINNAKGQGKIAAWF